MSSGWREHREHQRTAGELARAGDSTSSAGSPPMRKIIAPRASVMGVRGASKRQADASSHRRAPDAADHEAHHTAARQASRRRGTTTRRRASVPPPMTMACEREAREIIERVRREALRLAPCRKTVPEASPSAAATCCASMPPIASVAVLGGTNSGVTRSAAPDEPAHGRSLSCSARSVNTPGLEARIIGMSPSSARSASSVLSPISDSGPDANTIAPLGVPTDGAASRTGAAIAAELRAECAEAGGTLQRRRTRAARARRSASRGAGWCSWWATSSVRRCARLGNLISGTRRPDGRQVVLEAPPAPKRFSAWAPFDLFSARRPCQAHP